MRCTRSSRDPLLRRMQPVFLVLIVLLCGCQSQWQERSKMQGTSAYRLGLLKIPVSDIDRSATFYRDALLLEPQFVAAEYGWAQFQAGDLPLALYKPGMGGGEGPVGGTVDFHLSLDAAPFDALASKLLAQGVLVENMIHRGDDGSTFIDVRDPDGNVLKISRSGA